MSRIPHFTAALKSVLPAVALLLSACSAEIDLGHEDAFIEPMHYNRHPIEVARGTLKLKLASSSPYLSAAQENALLRFADEAQGAATGAVVISRPSGSRNAQAVSAKAAVLLAHKGIAGHAVRHATYHGGRYDPVIVSYSRTFATVHECGDWSRSLTITGFNEPYRNFGCAQQQNIAAMVANPEDIVTPRGQTPPDAMRRSQVFTDYRKPQDPSTDYEDAEVATVSEVSESK